MTGKHSRWLWCQQRLLGPKSFHGVLALIVLGLLAVLLLWPLLNIVSFGFLKPSGSFTFEYLQLVLEDPVVLRGLLKATGIALLTTLVALGLALPLALIFVRYEFPGRKLLSGLILVPLVLPPFVGAMGTRLLLARYGPITLLIGGSEPLGVDWLGSLRVVGVVLIEALSLYPIVLLNLQASLANVDPVLLRAADNLGAGGWTAFRRITWPLIRPGLLAGCTLVMIWSFSELGTPLMFHVYDVTPVQIFTQLAESDNPLPYALVVVLLAVSSLLYGAGKWAMGSRSAAAASKVARAHRLKPLRGLRAWAAALPVVGIMSLALLPHAAVLLTSVSKTGAWYRSLIPREFTGVHYLNALRDNLVMPSWVEGSYRFGAMGNSILYAGAATMLSIGMAVAVSLLVVRSKVPWRGALDLLGMLPLAIPGLVLAFGYLSLSVSARRTWGEATPSWLDVQQLPVVFLVVAYAIRRLPYALRCVAAGLEQVPLDYERAAANLGAKPCTTARVIVLPLCAGSVVAGAVLAFVFSMLEVSDSLILAQSAEYFPITRAIWELSQRLGDGLYVASALGVWAMLLLSQSLMLTSSILGKKMGALFRI